MVDHLISQSTISQSTISSQFSICLAHPSHPFSNFDRFVVYTCEMIRWDEMVDWEMRLSNISHTTYYLISLFLFSGGLMFAFFMAIVVETVSDVRIVDDERDDGKWNIIYQFFCLTIYHVISLTGFFRWWIDLEIISWWDGRWSNEMVDWFGNH